MISSSTYNAGLTAYLFQLTMTMGLRRVAAAPAAAVSYLTVVWGLAAGILVFGEMPNVLSLIGALVICVGTLAVVLSESWSSRQEKRHHESLQAAQTAGSHAEDEEEQESESTKLLGRSSIELSRTKSLFDRAAAVRPDTHLTT